MPKVTLVTKSVLSELDKIINLMEAKIPANPRSPENVKHEKRLEREMRKYFKDLEQAFDYGALGKIYNRYVKEA